MAKVKVIVKNDCMNANRDFLQLGSVLSIDDKKDAKLFDLGLVEKFDAKKHTEKKDEVSELKEQIINLKEAKVNAEEKIVEVEGKLADMKKMVIAAMALPKDEKPEGFEE